MNCYCWRTYHKKKEAAPGVSPQVSPQVSPAGAVVAAGVDVGVAASWPTQLWWSHQRNFCSLCFQHGVKLKSSGLGLSIQNSAHIQIAPVLLPSNIWCGWGLWGSRKFTALLIMVIFLSCGSGFPRWCSEQNGELCAFSMLQITDYV